MPRLIPAWRKVIAQPGRFTLQVLSLSLADLGGVCEGVLHALPDVLRNFDTVSARP
jgi:hypothetical protein